MKRYWASIPAVAKAAFLLATVSGAYLAGLLVFAMIMGSQNPGSRDAGPIGIVVGGFFTLVMTCAPLAVIAILLGIESVAARLVGAALAALTAISGIMVMMALTFAIGPVESGPGVALWIPFGVLGAAYAPVAYIGFRDAVRLSRQGAQPHPLA